MRRAGTIAFATFTPPDVRHFIHTKDPWIIPIRSVATAAGGSTYVTDVSQLKDTAGYAMRNRIASGMWIGRYEATDDTDRQRQTGGNGGDWHDLGNGRLYHDGKTYANNPGQDEPWELSSIEPEVLFNIMVQTLDEFPVPVQQILDAFTDASMDYADATTYWTASNLTGASGKSTTRVDRGSRKSLKLVLSAANGYYESKTYVRVRPGASYFVATSADCEVGGPAKLIVWDKTNNTEVESSLYPYSSLQDFSYLWRIFTAPAGCYQVAIRLQGTSTGDTLYFSRVAGPWRSNQMEVDLPEFVKEADQVLSVQSATYHESVSANARGAYVADSRTYDEALLKGIDYGVRTEFGYGHPAVLELRNQAMQKMWPGEIWYTAKRKASDVTTWTFDAASELVTCDLPLETYASAVIRNVAQYVIDNVNAKDVEANATLNRLLGPMVTTRRGGVPVMARSGGTLNDLLERYEKSLKPPERVVQRRSYLKVRF